MPSFKNGKKQGMRKNNMSQKKNSQRNSDIIELYLIIRVLLCFDGASVPYL